MSDSPTSNQVAAYWREQELTYIVNALATALGRDDDEQHDALCDLREWAKNRLKAQLPAETMQPAIPTVNGISELSSDNKAQVATSNPRLEGELREYARQLVSFQEESKRQAAEIERLRAAFKNFHRLLCERFDYAHDERDWERDQLSLIEWIAKRYSRGETDGCRYPMSYGKRCDVYPNCDCGVLMPPEEPRETTPALTEALCFEGEKDSQLDQLLDYLHYDSDTRSHPDWVARAQTAEAELAKWKANCTGKHGSQMPCVESLPEEPFGSFAGRGPDDAEFGTAEWRRDNPQSPKQASGGPANDFSNLGPPTQEWLDRSQGLTGLEYDEHGERLPEKASCSHEARPPETLQQNATETDEEFDMSEFKTYPRKGSCTARPYVPGEDMTGISVSDADKALPSLDGGMIARARDNHADQWYVNPTYFANNYSTSVLEDIEPPVA